MPRGSYLSWFENKANYYIAISRQFQWYLCLSLVLKTIFRCLVGLRTSDYYTLLMSSTYSFTCGCHTTAPWTKVAIKRARFACLLKTYQAVDYVALSRKRLWARSIMIWAFRDFLFDTASILSTLNVLENVRAHSVSNNVYNGYAVFGNNSE